MKHHHHHSFNVSVPLKVGRTAPMFVLSFFLHSILLAGSALDSFQCLRSLLIVSFHVFFGLPRPRCPTTSNSVMLLIQPSFLTTCPNQRSRLYLNKVCMLYFKTNLDSGEIIPQYMLLSKSQKSSESIDKGKYGCGIFIDLRKASDTVNHGILLKKLEHYGIRDNMLDWFQSYLSDRKQHVDINGKSSDLLDIACGVPQGSVLGPLLFLIYINDLPNISKILNFYLFADDTNIY